MVSVADGLTEHNLRLFQAVVEQAPDAIIFADREGLIRIWNRGAETIFGFSCAETLGKSLDMIIPDRLRAPHWQGFHSALASGQTKHSGHAMLTRSMHKDGSKLYVDMSFSLIKDASGTVIGALAIGRKSAKEKP